MQQEEECHAGALPWRFKGIKTTVHNATPNTLQQINTRVRVQNLRVNESRVVLDGVIPARAPTL